MRLTAVSLFAGVGGFDLAMQRNGIDVVATVEIDKAARGVLERRFPETTHFTDVTEVTGDQLRDSGFVPDRGILTGGFPCQDLSVAGRRAGLGGGRSGLFWEIARLAAELRPRWLVLENVPGLLSSGHADDCPGDGCSCCAPGRDLGIVLGTLGELGYGWAYRILDAQFFGVAQRRRRVFIVGRLGDDGRAPGEVLALREGVRGHPAPSRAAGKAVAGTLGGGAGSRGWAPDTDRMTFVPLTARQAKDPDSDANHLIAHTLTTEYDASEDGTGRGVPLVPFVKVRRAQTNQDDETWAARPVAPTLNVMDNTGDVRATVAIAFSHENGMDPQPSEFVTPTLKVGSTGQAVMAPATAATLTAGLSSPGVSAPGRRQEDDENLVTSGLAVRRLTPVECERLQGFPDGWTEGQSDSARYKQMGNAVAVPVVEWIMRRLTTLESEGEHHD